MRPAAPAGHTDSRSRQAPAAGEHPKVVSERLGHATVGITLDTYSHVLPGLQAAAAERLADVLGAASVSTDS